MSLYSRRTDASASASSEVRRALLAWYALEQRDLPWRHTRDPWAVLVSEVMLQQTQAARVAERFPPFLRRFPTPRAMAAAGDAEVLAAWSGLGYNRRALALRRSAMAITDDGWPADVDGLQRLPGVGPYTARAVAALAFGQAVGAVDTNVRRWLIRRFGLPLDARATQLQELAGQLATAGGAAVPVEEAAAWMHASMEFGAGICRARDPRCNACPLRSGCPSRDAAASVPVKRQPQFDGSARQARGALMRALSLADGHRLRLAEARLALGGGAGLAELATLVAALERDGLAHRSGSWLHLGGRPVDEPGAATIGP